MKQNVVNIENKKVGDMELADEIFAGDVRTDILHRVVCWQLAKRRAGTHKTKGISDISGTTRKPWRQKGTGRARQGSLRSPQFRGGAVIHGPVVRDHGYSLPKKVRRLGLKSALADKVHEGKIVVLDTLALESLKTKDFKVILEKFGFKSVLIVDAENENSMLKKAVANLHKIDFLPEGGLNVYDLLQHENLMITSAAVKKLEGRLK